MKKELMKLMGPNYAENDGNITDRRVQGYDSRMNVAKIRERKGALEVNRFDGVSYRPLAAITFASVQDAFDYIIKGVK